MTGVEKVCHIVSTFHPIIGGTQRATANLCRELVDRGINVVVLTRRLPRMTRLDIVGGVRVYRLGYPSRGKFGAFTFGLHALWILMTRFWRFRIIHVQNLDTPLLVGFLSKALLGRHIVTTIHGENKVSSRQNSAAGKLRLRLLRMATDVFVALTEATEIELTDLGVPRSRIHRIPNGIDTSKFRPPRASERQRARQKLQLNESHHVVLFVGRLVALKRVDLLLRAWAQLPRTRNCRLLIVGDGPQRRGLEKLASYLSLDDVNFAGATGDTLSYFHAADIFVLPSEREGLSVALLEALATGLTVIATAIPGNLAVIRHGENGLTVPVNDLEALTHQIDRAFRLTSIQCQMGRNADEIVRESYSLHSVAQRHESLYCRVANLPG